MEIPALHDIASASSLVGVLFVIRHLVAMRRIWAVDGWPRAARDVWRATRTSAYGPAFEPDRRHAARQLYVGLAFLALGLLLFAGILAQAVLGPVFTQAGLT